MSLHEDIVNLLQSDGYPTTEVILDALADFVAVVQEEMESVEHDEDIDDEE